MTSTPRLFIRHALLTLIALVVALAVASLVGNFDIGVGNIVLRTQRGVSYPLSSPAPSTKVDNELKEPQIPEPQQRPRNVILFIGDGMGMGHVSAASDLLIAPGASLAMTDTTNIGLMRTWAANNLTTDSAASGTAIATGYKTAKKAVGVLADGREVRNLIEAARARGMAAGVMTTSGLVDATPASFLAHVDNRDDFAAIFEQALDSGAEVLIGGDFSREPKALRNDRYQDLVASAEALGGQRGYTVVRTPQALQGASGPVLALFPPRSGSRTDHGPPLEVSARCALRLLEKAPAGFVLMIESEVTDTAAHANDIAALVDGMRELDEAVAAALRFADQHGDTLVLVTADHDAGTPAITSGDYQTGRTVVRWATDGHSSQWVPLFAFGPGAEEFTGVLENTQIAPRIGRLLGLEPLPQRAQSIAH
jgi:alkaline phosphatase